MFSYVHSGLATEVFQMFKISRTEVPMFTTHKIIIVKTYNIIMLVQLNSFQPRVSYFHASWALNARSRWRQATKNRNKSSQDKLRGCARCASNSILRRRNTFRNCDQSYYSHSLHVFNSVTAHTHVVLQGS